MRLLLFKLFGLSLYESLDEIITKIRKSVYFMEKVATISIEDLAMQVLEYANLQDAIEAMTDKPVPMQQRLFLFYITHMFDLAPDAYGLLKPAQ